MPVLSPDDLQVKSQTFDRNPFRGLAANLMAAQEEERCRISRELHDELGQRLALLEIQIEEMERRIGGDARIHSELESFRANVAHVADDVHRICYQLHPVILENLGLVPAVRSYCEEFSTWSGVRTRFSHCDIPASLPSTVSLCLYRVIQEALRNVARHSGAKCALILLRAGAGGLEAVIRDHGRGFLPDLARKKGGLGLISLGERARLAGGRCTIRSTPGRGTTIQALIPLAMQAVIE